MEYGLPMDQSIALYMKFDLKNKKQMAVARTLSKLFDSDVLTREEYSDLLKYIRRMYEERVCLALMIKQKETRPVKPSGRTKELTEEQIQDVLEDFDTADRYLADYYREEGLSDREIAEILYFH